jgi:hypothetical protein
MRSSIEERLYDLLHKGVEVDEFRIVSSEELQDTPIPANASQVVLNMRGRDAEVYHFKQAEIDVTQLGLVPIRLALPQTINSVLNKISRTGKCTDCFLIERHYDEFGADGQQVDVYAASVN